MYEGIIIIIVVDVLTFIYTYIAILWGIVCCLFIPMSRILCQQKAVNQVYLRLHVPGLYIYIDVQRLIIKKL